MTKPATGSGRPARSTGWKFTIAMAAAIAMVGAPSASRPGGVAAATLPAGVTAVPATMTFHGRGYGHGVGLSQYGARGRAVAGQTAAAIVAHYYTGTTPARIAATTPARILLLDRWSASSSAPLVVVARGGEWTVEGIAATLPADARLTLTPSVTTTTGGTAATWRLRVLDRDGRLLHDSIRNTSFRIRTAVWGGSLELPAKPTGRNRYRGVLRVIPRADGPRASVVNELALDHYLRGVVPAEMPYTWPTEALRAQAIVARSYAARALRPGTSYFDVYDDTRSQAYHGILGERYATNAAISATAGRVLMSGSAIASTLFHSTAGGYTENNENVFVSSTGARLASPVSYLRGVPDRAPDGTAYDAAAPSATWTSGSWSATQVSSWLAKDGRTNVGTLAGIDLRDRGVSGRLISVTLYGSTGTKRVSGAVFRSVVNAHRTSGTGSIRSTLFDLKPIP